MTHFESFKAFSCSDLEHYLLNENEKYTHRLAPCRFHQPKFEATLG